MEEDTHSLNKNAQICSQQLNEVIEEIHRVIIGQDAVIEKLILALVADGHVLLEGMPGLAKTLMIKTLSDTIEASYKRIQFTPDLLPADITGTRMYNQHTCTFTTKKGPIFANFILADEINRAPPKVQSALLEAMQERQVTISDESHQLGRPFLVMATQNPIETQGTYELPEAQVDRFMFKVLLDYPTQKQEQEILAMVSGGSLPEIRKVISPARILEIQEFAHRIYMDEKISKYITDLVQATRKPELYGLDTRDFIEYGASPRASIYLALGGKAGALLAGRGYVTPQDVKSIARDVLRHRIILTYEALAEDVTTDKIIGMILEKVLVP
ncbi:ATPase family associated with various cellular activities (AAA) [uncultured archaeon]|nr:ATPase family associated with various cellular activities (AAA) [uncultured archaeon]